MLERYGACVDITDAWPYKLLGAPVQVVAHPPHNAPTPTNSGASSIKLDHSMERFVGSGAIWGDYSHRRRLPAHTNSISHGTEVDRMRAP